MNTKIQISAIARTLLTAIGSFLIGKTVFGHDVNGALWEQIAGILMAVGSTVWGIWDKTATVEKIQSTIRQLVTFAGGFLVAAGKLTNNNLEALLALIPVIIPYIQSHLARVKNNQLAEGVINTQQLKK